MIVSSSYVAVCLVIVCIVFFFKQKTAYEMRISDWSSDVCSSDLCGTSSGCGGSRCRHHATAAGKAGASRPFSLHLRARGQNFLRVRIAPWEKQVARCSRDTPQVLPCRLIGDIHVAEGPANSGQPASTQLPGVDRKSTRLNSSH